MANKHRGAAAPQPELDAKTLQVVHDTLLNHMEENPEEGTAALLEVVERLREKASDG